MAKVIGRKEEIAILKDALKSDKSELIAVLGRRRVGKTYLIREVYKNDIIFEVSGLFQGKMHDQLHVFIQELKNRKKKGFIAPPSNWLEAFLLLETHIQSLKSKKKKVIFIDEFPWLATAKSKFLMAFEHFWNHYCTKRTDLVVVICGSAASYMIQNIVRNKGGLHNRITRQIRLLPFSLLETDLFLKSKNIRYTHYDVTQLYMAMGGVPHYLEKIQKGWSVAQNIDHLCFSKDGILKHEFDQLFSSLFDNSEKHIAIIKVLSSANKGLTRQGIIQKSNIPSGGDFSLKMSELIESGFVTEYTYFGNKKQLSLYRLSDEYTKFYLKFIQNHKHNGKGTWLRLQKSPSYTSWSGFCFETVCLKHIQQIKQALGISALYTIQSSWFHKDAQIDLVIDRDDHIINVCEMKFYQQSFALDKKMYLNLKNKLHTFQTESITRKNLYLVFISAFGIEENAYSHEIIQQQILLKDLFQ